MAEQAVPGAPHFPVREDWLATAREAVLDADQPILDPHHHLWDRPEGRYRSEELMADVRSGHDVRASIYVQCRTGYHATGSEALRPVGEVETITRWCAEHPRHPAAMVAFADMQLGSGIASVLDALDEAGGGRVRGIRNTTAYHSHPAVRSNPRPAVDGLLRTDAFRQAAGELARRGLVLDIWAYQSQLAEVAEIARAVPDLTVVVDHCGGPLGVGPYRRDDKETFAAWRQGMTEVAMLPNTRIKIGGFGLRVAGHLYGTGATPPVSARLASDWGPWVDTCLALFGPGRAMFESNFPVDKGQFGYGTLWNAFKRLAGDLPDGDRQELFWRSAARTYGIDETIFLTENGRMTG